MEINETRFPSNSYLKPTEEVKKERPKVEKVTTAVKTRKPSLAKKAKETFLAEDIGDVKSHIFTDVIVPNVIDFIMDVLHSTVDAVFGVGGRRSYSRRSRDNKKYTNYSSISYKSDDKPVRRVRGDGRFNVEEIIVETRAEGEEVIHRLADMCDEYGCATVDDLYSMVGITGDFTAHRWGWESVAQARVMRERGGGYLIDMPRPVYLD